MCRRKGFRAFAVAFVFCVARKPYFCSRFQIKQHDNCITHNRTWRIIKTEIKVVMKKIVSFFFLASMCLGINEKERTSI